MKLSKLSCVLVGMLFIAFMGGCSLLNNDDGTGGNGGSNPDGIVEADLSSLEALAEDWVLIGNPEITDGTLETKSLDNWGIQGIATKEGVSVPTTGVRISYEVKSVGFGGSTQMIISADSNYDTVTKWACFVIQSAKPVTYNSWQAWSEGVGGQAGDIETDIWYSYEIVIKPESFHVIVKKQDTGASVFDSGVVNGWQVDNVYGVDRPLYFILGDQDSQATTAHSYWRNIRVERL